MFAILWRISGSLLLNLAKFAGLFLFHCYFILPGNWKEVNLCSGSKNGFLSLLWTWAGFKKEPLFYFLRNRQVPKINFINFGQHFSKNDVSYGLPMDKWLAQSKLKSPMPNSDFPNRKSTLNLFNHITWASTSLKPLQTIHRNLRSNGLNGLAKSKDTNI